MSLPLPKGLADLVDSSGVNPSLRFYRTYDGYEADFEGRTAAGREDFLRNFAQSFAAGERREYEAFVERRRTTLERRGASCLTLTSTQRLVVGLGLPHPTETSLLLDRLTGCPFVPGSSVKGVLRQAARLSGIGELNPETPASSPTYWRDSLNRIFGPAIGEADPPAVGNAVFYDAFPAQWPALEVDVLTPHHTGYYGDPTQPPGDWEEPIPVPFLTVAAGSRFHFWFGPRQPGTLTQEDVAALRDLLLVALDWLGVGAKTVSQGYGTFSEAGPDPTAVTEVTLGRAGSKPAEKPTPKPETTPRIKGATTWTNVELSLDRRKATAYRGKKVKAECDPADLPAPIRKALKKGSLRVDADVEPGLGTTRRIVNVRVVSEEER